MATDRELVELYKEKAEGYEKILEELTNAATKTEGKVIKVSRFGKYIKVKTSENTMIVTSPELEVKEGNNVIVINNVIVEMLPDDLVETHKEETVDFDRISWDSIGGMKSQINSIKKKIEFPILHRKLYTDFKLKPPKGIILYGPTGCGKTLVAKAIASYMLSKDASSDHFIYLKGGELLNKYVGETENRIKKIFDVARKTYRETDIAPIIFIDEAEAILPQRGSRISSDVETTIVPTFLSEMDGFEKHNPFVILATNYLEMIDTAIQRPGRIDLKIYVGRPNIEDTVEIFKIYFNKTKIGENIDELAKKSAILLFSIKRLVEEVSGALIENIVNFAIENAMMRIIEGGKDEIKGVVYSDIEKSISNI